MFLLYSETIPAAQRLPNGTFPRQGINIFESNHAKGLERAIFAATMSEAIKEATMNDR
jgi:hypothetical protein